MESKTNRSLYGVIALPIIVAIKFETAYNVHLQIVQTYEVSREGRMKQMEMTPEVSERIRKNTEILKNIRMKGEKPTVCFLKLKRDEKLAKFHEIVADWFVDLPEGMDFHEAYEEKQFPENRLLAVIIPGNCRRELGINQDIFFPESFGQISSQSYFCIGFSKEEVFLAMKKRFQQRIEDIDRKAESMKRSKENLLSCLSVLDKSFR